MWSGAKNWYTGEKLIEPDFNEQLRDNMQFLYDRNIGRVTVRNGISDWTQSTLSTWQAIDPTVFFVEITTSGGDILFNLNLNIRNAGVLGETGLDIYVQPLDETPYLLSTILGDVAATPTRGLWAEQFGSSYAIRRSYRYLWRFVPAGSYKFTVYWKSETGASSLNYTNTVNEFTVEEYSVP